MNKTIIIIALIAIAGGVYFTLPKPEEKSLDKLAVSHFRNELVLGVVSEIGQPAGQPIHGVDVILLRHAFPKFVLEDFDGIKTLEGVYAAKNGKLEFTRIKEQPITSAEKMIAEESYGLLLQNVSTRLGVEIENPQSVDPILKTLLGPQVGLDILAQATFQTKIVYGTDATLDQDALAAHCRRQRGTYNTCGSICEPGEEVCADVCAFTCEDILVQSTGVMGNVSGRVVLGPQCPAAKEGDESCDDKPYETAVTLHNESESYALTVDTDEQGAFTADIPFGIYTISARGDDPFPVCQEQDIEVGFERVFDLTLLCDTGIR